MRFSWDILLNMLENDVCNLQTNFGVHITSNIFKIIQFKNHIITPPPSQWKLAPSSGDMVGVLFCFVCLFVCFFLFFFFFFFFAFFFFAKMSGKDELKVTQGKFTPWLSVFQHRFYIRRVSHNHFKQNIEYKITSSPLYECVTEIDKFPSLSEGIVDFFCFLFVFVNKQLFLMW